MGDKIKISVIMPVYQVEQYVGKAIRSMQRQTLKEFELLIVDDGSPDRSGEICDEYAKKDKRISVIHKENGGAHSARNAAMEIAKGKYLFFMDSDDWAEPDMLADMYDLAEKSDAQMVVAGFYIDTYYKKHRCISEKICAEAACYGNARAFRKNAYRYFDKNMLYTPWNKLYLASYLKERRIRFPHTLWDDFPFNVSVVRGIERVSILGNAYYHFIRARADSETAAYHPGMYRKREEEHKWLRSLFKEWGIHSAEAEEMLARRYIERVVGCVENLTNPNCAISERERRRQVREIFENPNVGWALRKAAIRSRHMKAMLLPVRWRNITLMLLEARILSWAKRKNVKLFAMLKASR